MLRSIKVRDYMTTHLLTFRPDTDLYRAIELLLEHRLSAAPVVDENGQLVGAIVGFAKSTAMPALVGIIFAVLFAIGPGIIDGIASALI